MEVEHDDGAANRPAASRRVLVSLGLWLPARYLLKCPKGLATSQVLRCGCARVQEGVARLGFTTASRVRAMVLEKVRPWAVSTSGHTGRGHGGGAAPRGQEMVGCSFGTRRVGLLHKNEG